MKDNNVKNIIQDNDSVEERLDKVKRTKNLDEISKSNEAVEYAREAIIELIKIDDNAVMNAIVSFFPTVSLYEYNLIY